MPMSYKEAVAYAKELDVKLVPYENEHGMAGTKAAMEQIEKGESIAVFIGPEGGFAPEEIALVQDEMQLISLGKGRRQRVSQHLRFWAISLRAVI